MPFFQAAACLLFGLSLALLAQRWEGASQSRDLGVHTVVFPLPGAPDGSGGHLEPTLISATRLVQRLSQHIWARVSCHGGATSPLSEAGIPLPPDGAPQMQRGGYQVPSAQTRPHSGREEGCDFVVLRACGGSPEKSERGQASGSAPALTPGTWGPTDQRSGERILAR